jgi:hypothetical protein
MEKKAMARKIIKKFDGGYKRVGIIWVDNVVCNLCGKKKPCIMSDGSDSEYKYACICPACATAECEKMI